MFSVLLVVLCFACRVAVAQSSLSIVCVAGQCFQGISNTTIGATLSGPGGTPRLQLLPGQYTSTTSPQLLHNLLASTLSTLVGSAGFRNASLSSLPLNLQLEPGVAVYSQSLYSGQALFAKLPESPVSNATIPLSANSIAIAPNVWIAVSNNNNRLILWDSVPDVSQLPSRGSLSLLDIQSSTCSPPCSGTSICSISGTCTCPTGFSGSACESCADGFFGPTCAPCPTGCSDCDQGISGSGRCLTPINNVDSLPAKCNCLNGVCGTDGRCTCNSGWTTGNNGTACAKCAPGFFLSTTGDCQVCQLGCVQCADGTGDCITCKTGFTQDANDKTKCTRLPNRTSDPPPCVVGVHCVTAVPCPDGSFPSGGQCSPCSPSCLTCTGPTSNDCTLCAQGTYFFNGNCVSADGNGVCQGTNGMIANNVKFTCDSCGAKCTSCRIPNFSTASTMDLLQCTGCLPGFFLFEGKCIAGCSTGTFASQDDSCSSCSSSCSTCAGSPDFCLTCPSGQFASSGRCVSSCPSDTFSSNGTCTKCHPDCATCSGASFNQCNSCPSSRPVRLNGRCLSTCSRTQYYDPSSLACQTCDTSCSSCSGPGPSNCLACSGLNQVLRSGSCVSLNCQGSSGIIPGLGVCLSELVQVSTPSGTASPAPSGLTEPTKTSSNLKLTWWQILLMTLGCAFILLILLWFWRRRARKQREKKTQDFAREKNLDGVHGWLVRLGRRLFRNKRNPQSNLPMTYAHDSPHSPKIQPIEHDVLLKKLAPPRSEGKARSEKRDSMDDFLDAYERSIDSRASSVSSVSSRRQSEIPRRYKSRIDRNLYSEVTGRQRSTPDPRESLYRDPVTVRDSIGSSIFVPSLPKKFPMNREGVPVDSDYYGYQSQLDRQNSSTSNQPYLTDAQLYMQSVRPTVSGETGVSSRSQATPSSFPIPTYTTAPNYPQQIGPMTFGSVPQITGRNHIAMHGSLPGNGQGPYPLPPAPQIPFMMSSGPNVTSQPMQTGESYVAVSSRNPFRNLT